MPHLTTDDGVKLYYEEVGAGAPIVFVHEFAGDWRSWEHQLRYFGRRYRCIAYNARGFPPSDVPDTVERYSQERARDDIKAVLDALRIDKAHNQPGGAGSIQPARGGLPARGRCRAMAGAGSAGDGQRDLGQVRLRGNGIVVGAWSTQPPPSIVVRLRDQCHFLQGHACCKASRPSTYSDSLLPRLAST
jgi:pimeloyl-ACP methyl ester carboxylesterase